MYMGNDVRQTANHTAEPIVPEPTASEFKMDIEEVRSNTSPGFDHIPAKLTKASGTSVQVGFINLLFTKW
jgi:hypothetical protein